MTQRPMNILATLRDIGGNVLQSLGPYRMDTRRDLVAFTDHCLAAGQFSARARRQVDLVRVWRIAQSGMSPHWRIDATESCGNIASIAFSS